MSPLVEAAAIEIKFVTGTMVYLDESGESVISIGYVEIPGTHQTRIVGSGRKILPPAYGGPRDQEGSQVDGIVNMNSRRTASAKASALESKLMQIFNQRELFMGVDRSGHEIKGNVTSKGEIQVV